MVMSEQNANTLRVAIMLYLQWTSALVKISSCSLAERKIKFPIDVGSLRNKRPGNAAPAFEIILFQKNSALSVRRAEMSDRARGISSVERQEAQNFESALLFVLYPARPACGELVWIHAQWSCCWLRERASRAIYRCPILFYVVIQLHIKAIQLRRHSTNSYNPYRTTWIKTHTLCFSAAYNTHTHTERRGGGGRAQWKIIPSRPFPAYYGLIDFGAQSGKWYYLLPLAIAQSFIKPIKITLLSRQLTVSSGNFSSGDFNQAQKNIYFEPCEFLAFVCLSVQQ